MTVERFIRGDQTAWPEALASFRRDPRSLPSEAVARLQDEVAEDHRVRLGLRPFPVRWGITTRQMVYTTAAMRMYPGRLVMVFASHFVFAEMIRDDIRKMAKALGLAPCEYRTEIHLYRSKALRGRGSVIEHSDHYRCEEAR